MPVFENGNSFIHELVDRKNIDWLFDFGVCNINGYAKNEQGETVLDFLRDRSKHAGYSLLMVDRLIRLLECEL